MNVELKWHETGRKRTKEPKKRVRVRSSLRLIESSPNRVFSLPSSRLSQIPQTSCLSSLCPPSSSTGFSAQFLDPRSTPDRVAVNRLPGDFDLTRSPSRVPRNEPPRREQEAVLKKSARKVFIRFRWRGCDPLATVATISDFNSRPRRSQGPRRWLPASYSKRSVGQLDSR